MDGPLMRGFLLGCLCLMLLSTPASAAPPRGPSFLAQLESAQAENARLRVKLRKARKANRYHARWVRKLRAANRDRLAFGAHGVVQGFLCIHRFEGSWADDGAPFWGGMQMDRSFMSSYGGPFLAALGTANHWPPFVQVAVGMEAYYSGRGFHPWPNTARKCGLL